jgi:hypothetical protein
VALAALVAWVPTATAKATSPAHAHQAVQAALTVVVATRPKQALTFAFALDTRRFTLRSAPGVNQTRFELDPGTHQLREFPHRFWPVSEIDCSDPDNGSQLDVEQGSATVDVDAGEQFTCTFTSLPSIAAPHREDLVLARRYAPVLKLAGKTALSRRGEEFEPIAISQYLSVSVLRRGPPAVGSFNPIVDGEPAFFTLPEETTSACASRTCDYLLDVVCPDGCEPAQRGPYVNVQRQLTLFYGFRPTVYWSLTRGSRDSAAIQYWFLYLYNDWANRHEADWEHIVLLFKEGVVQYALYAKHNGVKDYCWSRVERVQTHPVVYVARGSHASYIHPTNVSVVAKWHGIPVPGLERANRHGKTLDPDHYQLLRLAGPPFIGAWTWENFYRNKPHFQDPFLDPRARPEFRNPIPYATRLTKKGPPCAAMPTEG